MDQSSKIETLRKVIENKDHALRHALDRLETIEMFSAPKFNVGTHWESGATITRVKMALKLNEDNYE